MHVSLLFAVAFAAALMYLAPAVVAGLRSQRVRLAGKGALHLAHFDHDVKPSRTIRRSMHKRLNGFWMLADETGSVTLGSFKGRSISDMIADPRPISGGDGTGVLDKPIDVEKASLKDLKKVRSEIAQRSAEFITKAAEEGVDEHLRTSMKEAADEIIRVDEAIAIREGDESTLSVLENARKADEAYREANKNARPPIYGDGNEPNPEAREAQTPGSVFVRSSSYEDWMKRYPEGAPSRGKADSDAVAVPSMRAALGLVTPTERLALRALITAADTSAGDLVRPQYLGLLEPGLVRPLTIRDLVTVVPTTGDAIEYTKEVSRTSAAAPVPEATQIAATGNEVATKPEGGLVFDVVTDTVKTIAEWVAATKRILSDSPQLRAYIDQYLTDDLALELEDQMIAGSGAGENFTGILNTTGTIPITGPSTAANQSEFDRIRAAKTQIRLQGRTQPTAVALNPEDWEAIELRKVNDEVNHFAGAGPYGSNQPRMWGLPVVETEAVPAGTALVGDFRKAILFDREQISISVGTAGDDFIRNLVRVLAEMRAGFGVLRPKAFAEVSLTQVA